MSFDHDTKRILRLKRLARLLETVTEKDCYKTTKFIHQQDTEEIIEGLYSYNKIEIVFNFKLEQTGHNTFTYECKSITYDDFSFQTDQFEIYKFETDNQNYNLKSNSKRLYRMLQSLAIAINSKTQLKKITIEI